MSNQPSVKLPNCPTCRTPLDVNGVDEKSRPAVIVYSCRRCAANYFHKVNLP